MSNQYVHRDTGRRIYYRVYLHEVQAYDWSDLPTNSSSPKTITNSTYNTTYLYDKLTPDIVHVLYDTAENSEDHVLNGKINLEINKAGSFEFDILPSHSCYAMLRTFIQYIRVTSYTNNAPYHVDERIQFYGRISNISLDISGTKHVTCEGLLSNLSDVPMYFPIAPDVQSLYTNRLNKFVNGNNTEYHHQSSNACIMETLKSYYKNIRKDIYPIINLIGFVDFPSDPSDTADNPEIDWSNGSPICDVLFDAFVKTYGGYIYMKYYSDSKGDVLGQIYYGQSIDMNSSSLRTLTFGDNILDISFEHEGEICSAVIPIWRSTRKLKEDGTHEPQEKRFGAINTGTNESGQVTRMPQICGYVGEQTVGAKMLDLPDVTDQSTALRVANRYFNENCYKDFNMQFNSITVKLIDGYYTGSSSVHTPISLLTPARIVSEIHEIDVTLPCLAIEINIDNFLENSYTFKKYSSFDDSTALVISRRLQRK